MRAEGRWYELLLADLVLVLLLSRGTLQTADAYEYVEGTPEASCNSGDYYSRNDSTYREYSYADSAAEDNENGSGDCSCSARVCEMLEHPDRIRKELDIVQARWVSYQMSAEVLERDLRQNILDAKGLFAKLDQPTRDHKALRAQIEKLEPGTEDAEDL